MKRVVHGRLGCITYYDKDGINSRVGGPANIVIRDGYESWYQDGKLHREDGPAIILPNGTEKWIINNREIRIIAPDGSVSYPFQGKGENARRWLK